MPTANFRKLVRRTLLELPYGHGVFPVRQPICMSIHALLALARSLFRNCKELWAVYAVGFPGEKSLAAASVKYAEPGGTIAMP